MGMTAHLVKSDILRTYNMIEDNRFKRFIWCFRSPGLYAAVTLRLGAWLRQQNILVRILLEPWYLLQYHRIRAKWGIEIPRSVEIGEGFYIGHFGGITISPAARIGRNAALSQGVTIGVSGQGAKRGAPTIGDDVYIGAGAKVIGKIHIGNNVKIGANAVVYKDVPDNAVVALDPGFIILSFKGNHPTDTDQASQVGVLATNYG
jgi:serine O-acetyltransferase